ncbi:hypothetical protein [Nocardioides sp. zg-DK7169]|nr:hypothetical protein [Nocardioides sp. zg-DK7169]
MSVEADEPDLPEPAPAFARHFTDRPTTTSATTWRRSAATRAST